MMHRVRNMPGLVLIWLGLIVLGLAACDSPLTGEDPAGLGGGETPDDQSDQDAGDPGGQATPPPPFDGILVTSSADSGPGSLRQAVIDAQPGDEIRFAAHMTITLEGDRRGIEVDKDITINGIGRTVIIEGSGAQRHFTHMPDPGGPYVLTLANLTLRNGEPRTETLLPGGSVYVAGGSTATFENVTFESNLGTNGGAIFVEQVGATASVIIRGSTFTSNEARGFTGTGAPAGAGGAIYAMDTNLIVTDSVFESNEALEGNPQQPNPMSGGAIAINGSGGSVIRGSTFHSNTAGLYGGAISARNGSLDVISSLFEANRAGVAGTQFLYDPATGGAIHALNQGTGVLLVGRSRFVRNRAEGPDNAAATRIFRGGAISNFGQPLAILSSEFFGNYVGDTGADGRSASIAPNAGSAVYHVAASLTHGIVISSSAFVGNVASGADYNSNTAQGSAVASESENILYDVSFSTFAQNVGTAGYEHLWFAGEGLVLASTAFQFTGTDELTLPDPGSASSPLVRDVIALSPHFDSGGAWAAGNRYETPSFVRMPSPGTDGAWGTSDDDYGDLVTIPSVMEYESPTVDLGNGDDLVEDIMDLDGDGDATERLPVDAQGLPRQVGLAPDIGAYERQM